MPFTPDTLAGSPDPNLIGSIAGSTVGGIAPVDPGVQHGQNNNTTFVPQAANVGLGTTIGAADPHKMTLPPTNGTFGYADANAFANQGANYSFDLINGGLRNATTSTAPIAGLTALGHASQLNGANIGARTAAGGGQIAPQMMVNGATVSPAMQIGGAKLAPQMMYSGTNLNTAADQQLAQGQNTYMNSLAQQAAGNGPSLAEAQAKHAEQQNLAQQMSMIGSARGSSNPALAQRAAAQAGSVGHQQAMQAGIQGKLAEQQNAQNMLGQNLTSARGQSQSVALNQAQLTQQAQLQNQTQFNAAAQSQAQLQQQAALANQGQYGTMAGQQAALNQQAALANQSTYGTASGQQAALAQANAQFNAGQANTQNLNQAQLSQAAGLANQTANNDFAKQQGTMNQQINMANQDAQANQNTLNAGQYAQMLQAKMNLDQNQIANQAALQQMNQAAQLQLMGLDTGQQIASQNNTYGLIGAGISAAGAIGAGLASHSDRRLKTGIVKGDSVVKNFLEALKVKK